jgi:2-methylcitrate dehydratase PrpD
VIGASVYDQVTIDLAGGGLVQSEQVRRARGHAERPLSETDLFDKFRTCLDAGQARLSPEVLFGRLKNLENQSARELTAV